MSGQSASQMDIGYVTPPRGQSIDLRFSQWLRDNPKALRDFAEIADELIEAGERRLSAKFLIEIGRFRQIIRRESGTRYRLNNSFSSRLARALETTYPRFKGKFETRELTSTRGDA